MLPKKSMITYLNQTTIYLKTLCSLAINFFPKKVKFSILVYIFGEVVKNIKERTEILCSDKFS